MKPTEQLKAEHEGVKLMLEILNVVCEKLKSGQELNQEHFAKMLEFLKVFVDKCHHGKEEDLLFPALEEAGIQKEGGPIGVMLMEHNQGRGYVKGMSEAFDKFKKGDRNASAKIVENGESYIALLTQHIYKENNVLFFMADKVLSKTIQDNLEEEFEKLEVERIGLGKHEEFHKLLHRLKEIYLN
jgi:hemerythrin-like domain-containing protein